ncbi:Glycoside hydrolase family 18 protein [Mycena venus]|uniref:Glycoside hydrolase family 18 protein n=1 Tax=Mycena venus TaxID=2733690 RepID=A0A8H7D3A9_9AGAR|nr:Glycoside hydrolase family 18 protein [Mycena venus]
MILLGVLALAAQYVAATTAAASNYSAAVGWYASWHEPDVPLSSVLWSKYTHMTYAFACVLSVVLDHKLKVNSVPTVDPKSISLADSDQELLPQFVAAAHKNVGCKGGAVNRRLGGSQFYSSNLGSASNRTSFVKSVTNLIQKYNLDLVDFDWEYPGVQGLGCNTISTSDTQNFLSMLQELRASPIASNITLTAATAVVPFPTTNTSLVPQFATVLDWIAPMVYDLSWNWTAGSPQIQRALPSSPARRLLARSAVEAWVAAGIPHSKIVLGVPAYGHSFNVNATEAFLASSSFANATQLTPYPPYDTLNHTIGDKWDSTGGTDQCGRFWGPAGTWDFWALVDAGYLLANGSAAPGVPYQWDACSSTPYLYAEKHGVLISYDDPRSFTAKGAFVRANGLAGFSMWEVGGDPKGVLLDAILSAPANASLAITPSAAIPSPSAPTAGSNGALTQRVGRWISSYLCLLLLAVCWSMN